MTIATSQCCRNVVRRIFQRAHFPCDLQMMEIRKRKKVVLYVRFRTCRCQSKLAFVSQRPYGSRANIFGKMYNIRKCVEFCSLHWYVCRRPRIASVLILNTLWWMDDLYEDMALSIYMWCDVSVCYGIRRVCVITGSDPSIFIYDFHIFMPYHHTKHVQCLLWG